MPSKAASTVPGVGDGAMLGPGEVTDREGGRPGSLDGDPDEAAVASSGLPGPPARHATARTETTASAVTTAENGTLARGEWRPRPRAAYADPFRSVGLRVVTVPQASIDPFLGK
jgi:hypothetical protein